MYMCFTALTIPFFKESLKMFLFPCGLFQAATGMFRAALGCLCCLLLGGPIMIIVGIVMVSAPNNRESQVQAYNNAIASFNTNVFSGWSGTIANTQAQQATMSITVQGNMEGINPGESSVMTAGVSTQPNSVTFAFDQLSESFSSSPGYVNANVNYISCSSAYSTANQYCSSSSMQSKCRSQYGSGAIYSGGGCYQSSGSCGYCSYNTYLQSFCVVVTQSANNGDWQQSSNMRSCQYPFSSSSYQNYGSSSVSTIPFRVYSSSDPYLVLQQQTEGTNNFGLTRAQQTSIGLGLAAGGGVLTAFVIFGIVVIARMISGRQTSAPPSAAPALPMHDDPFGVPLQPAFAYGQQGGFPRPGYAQQQQYSPPTQAYGQPQPVYQPQYGQPQPQYGQPQPPYGQPQPQYGQPQPLYNQPPVCSQPQPNIY
jgi:hypothetical protein